MAGQFDPYYEWLGIPQIDQPPNHYRLLGLAPFESEPIVIAHAADRQMGHLHTFQSGPHGDLSQRLLNEVSAARLILLDPRKKAEYDSAMHATGNYLGRARRRRCSIIGALVVAGVLLAFAIGTIVRNTEPPNTLPPGSVGPSVTNEVPTGARPPENSKTPGEMARVFGDILTLPLPLPVPETPALPDAVSTATVLPNNAAPAIPHKPLRIPASKASQDSDGVGAAVSANAHAKDEPPQPRSTRKTSKRKPAIRSVDKLTSTDSKAASLSAPAAPTENADPKTTSSNRNLPEVVVELQAGMRPEKLPVPNGDSLARSKMAAAEIFDPDLRKAGGEALAISIVARRILRQAGEIKNDSSARYAFLLLALDAASRAADKATAFEAIDLLAGGYHVDPWGMKAQLIETWAKKPHKPSEALEHAMNALSLMGAAAEENAFAVADRMARLAMTEGAKGKDKDVVARARSGLADAEAGRKLLAKLQSARETLRDAPNDPEANLIVGRHLCLADRNWAVGCRHLVKASDPSLRLAAAAELDADTLADDPAAIIRPLRLGDLWWDLAEKADGKSRSAMLDRSSHWYRRAFPVVDDELLRIKIAKRLEEASKALQKTKATEDGASRTLIVNTVGMRLIHVAPGAFVMGSEDGKGREEESPPHKVRISRAYYLGQCEVTVGQYRQFVDASHYDAGADWRTHWKNQTPEQPVAFVNWNDAAAFCQWLSRKEGKTYRLPTEAEWEFACRAGTASKYCFGDADREFGEYAWYERNSDKSPRPVAQKRPNAWGFYDVHGNVCEWCADWYDANYYTNPVTADPLGPAHGVQRSLRGGSWGDGPVLCRTASRLHGVPGLRTSRRGFRVAREP